jgi:pyridoxamine 5'-phosphate oxidase
MQDVADDPMQQFNIWFEQAVQADVKEPNAMTLATANTQGRPSARIVLLKGVRDNSFVFYTNYNSQKGQELSENPYAALVFNWLTLEKQIRISGKVRPLDRADSEAYFQSRPKGSQIGAWASPQSQIIEDRQLLEDNVENLKTQYAEAEQLPCPPHWGGFEVLPDEIEFWQGRSSRLHDRIVYRKESDGSWKIERLAP